MYANHGHDCSGTVHDVNPLSLLFGEYHIPCEQASFESIKDEQIYDRIQALQSEHSITWYLVKAYWMMLIQGGHSIKSSRASLQCKCPQWMKEPIQDRTPT